MTIGDSAFAYCISLTSITIPDSVTSIGDSAFYGCDSLTSLTIPDSVTSIGDWVFYGCSNLTSLTIPNSVTTIGDAAFYLCRSLTSVTIGNSVTSIGEKAFAWCKNLTNVTIPDSLTSIGKEAFRYCYSLTDVYYTGTEMMWNSIDIADGNIKLTNAAIHYNYIVTSPDTYEIIDIQSTESGVELTVQANDTDISGKQTVMVAWYDENGSFIGLKQQQITVSDAAQNISVDIDKASAKTVKAFIWNALGYMMPASQPMSLDL